MNIQHYLEELAKDQLLVIAFPVFLLLIVIEMFIDKKFYTDKKDTLVSISLSLLTAVVEFIPKLLAFGAFAFLHSISPLQDIVQRQWWAWILLFFMDDFALFNSI